MWRTACLVTLVGLAVADMGCGADAPASGVGNGGHMWATGESGLMLSAFDGVTVSERKGPTGTTLRGLVAIDDQLAWAVGDSGTILATRDGGSTWTPQAVSVTSTLWSASFADAGRGYAVGDEAVIVRTTDAGATWTRLPVAAASGSLRGVATAPSGGLVLVVGEAGTVLRSADGGARFDRVPTPVTSTLNAVRLADDELRVLAVGAGGVVIASDDGGLTWRAETTASAPLRAVAFHDTGAIAVGAGGLIWRRAGASDPWTTVASGTSVDLAAVKFAREAPAFGWIVGNGGTVLYTSDGGAHFRPLAAPRGTPLTAVEDF